MQGDAERVGRMLEVTWRLSEELSAMSFGDPVSLVYNPLEYAKVPHEAYLRRFGGLPGRTVLVGMNPGPFGMAQTGVPFGDVPMIRDWMGISEAVGKPPTEHPKRPVQGFSFPRSEVSGARLWGWAAERFGTAERFFERFFVVNYCPLLFLHASGRNLTPDKLTAAEREPMLRACDRALAELIGALDPIRVVGVGTWAEKRAKAALARSGLPIYRILHPSPASPAANRGWAPQAEAELAAMGVQLE